MKVWCRVAPSREKSRRGPPTRPRLSYQECFRRGLKHEEFYVGPLEADPDGLPPWGTLEGDRSLYEFTEGSPPDAA